MTSLADQLRLLLPPVSYDGQAPKLSAVIEAEANALSISDGRSDEVHSTIYPDTGAGLADWERTLALPDPCLKGVTQTTEQRVQAVVSKLRNRGGQSRPFFIALAKSLGYDVTISTFRPARAGFARAGDPINGGDWSFAWRVNVPAVPLETDPVRKALECRLGQLKPAESILLFKYGIN